jgi:hypothetical protein
MFRSVPFVDWILPYLKPEKLRAQTARSFFSFRRDNKGSSICCKHLPQRADTKTSRKARWPDRVGERTMAHNKAAAVANYRHAKKRQYSPSAMLTTQDKQDTWDFQLCKDPQLFEPELQFIVRNREKSRG